MRRAHLLRSIGGGLGGPLRSLPQESVARAKPALEPDHSTPGRANPHSSLASRRGCVPLSSAGLAGATNPGGRFGRGAKPPAEWNVQGVASRAALGRRLAAGPFSSLSRFSDRLVRARAVPSSPRVGRLAGKRLDNQRSVWRAPSRLQDVPVLNEQASPALGAQPERSGKSSSLTRVKPDGSRRWRPRGSRARACGLARYPAGSESPRIPPPRWPPATARA